MTSEPEETSGPHDEEKTSVEKTSAETLATELTDEPLPADVNSSASPTPQQPEGEQRPQEAPAPAAELPAAMEALARRMTPLELSRCSPRQLGEMHEQLGGMMRGVVAELQARLCPAADQH